MSDAQIAANFLQKLFGSPYSGGGIYVCSLPNEDAREREPGLKEIVTRKPDEIKGHLARWDRADRAYYFCISTIRPGAEPPPGAKSVRCKANVFEVVAYWADIDLKDVPLGLDAVLARILALPIPPSLWVFSGNGLHCYWLLSEAILITPETIGEIEADLRLLADLVGGDLSCAEAARLMRLPGSHNTKRGEFKAVTFAGEGRRYHVEDIREMLVSKSPVVPRRAAPERAVAASNHWTELAAQYGRKSPIDVDALLAAVTYQGPGDSAVHRTELLCTASLIGQGWAIDEASSYVLAGIQAGLGAVAANWNWEREERAIVGMCRSAKAKFGERVERVEKKAAPLRLVSSGDGASGEAKPKKKPRGDTSSEALPVIVVEGVLKVLRERGMEIMLAEGELWLYRDGIWSASQSADEQMLRTLIQDGCAFFDRQHDTRVANAAWKLLHEHSGLYRADVPWLSPPSVACQNGILDILSGEFRPFRPDAYVRLKGGVSYEPGAGCPQFLAFLESLFSDQPESAVGLIALVQEWFGAGLCVGMLYREERKALILIGPSRSGKTELADIFRRLIGGRVAGTAVTEISERFGLASFLGASAWVRDDAINEGDHLDPQRFKTIVTGEGVTVEVKTKPAVSDVHLDLPVLLTTNSLPRAKDASDAIFNRSLILTMTNVVSEEDARDIRTACGVPRGMKLAQWIVDQEGPGILNWAIEGQRRLFERGYYNAPAVVSEANQRFKDDNNPVSEFARSAVVRSDYTKVARHDLLCAFHGWQLEMEGEAARAAGARWFFPKLRTAVSGLSDNQEHGGARYLTGLKLTEEGLAYWERHRGGTQLKGGSTGYATSAERVNASWNSDRQPQDTPF
jgi:P4 family phage/plasmid primase-like protien